MNKKQKSGCAGCFKYIIYIVFALAFYVMTSDVEFDLKKPVDTLPKPNIGGVVKPVSDELCMIYEQLNDTEKKIYDQLLGVVKDGGLTYEFRNVDYDRYSDAALRAVRALTFDHPEYFWLNSGYRTSGTYGHGKNNDTFKITLSCYQYWTYTTNPKKYTQTLQEEIDKIVDMANQQPNTFEKVRFVHDYLVQNVEYDHDALAEAKKTVHTAASEYIYSAYGCLVNKKAVCSGYAKAFQLIMYHLGISCNYVTGDAGGPHGWNYIELEDEYYFVDVTWDDGDHKDSQGNMKYPNDSEYKYFCITEETLEKNHKIDETLFEVPDCTATDYNYYFYNEYILDKYDRDAFAQIIAKQGTQKILSVKFVSLSEMQKAQEDLFENGNWSKIPELAGQSTISYGADDNHFVLTFYKE